MGTRPVRRGETAELVTRAIREGREHRRWTLVELAERLKQSGHPMLPSAISKIETGERRVDVDDLMAFAEVYGIDPSDLLRGEGLTPNLRQRLEFFGPGRIGGHASGTIFMSGTADGEVRAADGHLVTPEEMEKRIRAIARAEVATVINQIPQWAERDIAEIAELLALGYTLDNVRKRFGSPFNMTEVLSILRAEKQGNGHG